VEVPLTLATRLGSSLRRAASEDRPAGSALTWVFTIFPVLLRLTCGLVAAAVAPAVRTPPVSTPLLIAAIGVLTAWSLIFSVRTLQHGRITTPVVLTDLALTIAACLLIGRLVAPEVLPGQASWVANLSSTSVVVAHFALPASRSIPAGLVVTAAYALGAHLAGDDAEAVAHAATLLMQTGFGAALAALVRRSSRRADQEFADYRRFSRAALIARAAREAERRHNRDLHDTVLATLTVVGLGAVSAESPMLRVRAAADLRTLGEQAPGGTALPPEVVSAGLVPAGFVPAGRSGAGREALDDRLRAVLDRMRDLTPAVALHPCVVPPAVADALADSTAEALSNVVRHAPGAAVTLRLAPLGDTGVVIEVVDDGPGFDPGRVPLHRFGLRESVHGRMAAIGGRAEVDSAPGRGTRVRLEWADAG
jgi:signal transduction histidine kinase